MRHLLLIYVGADLKKKLLEMRSDRYETDVVLNILPSRCRKCNANFI